MDDSTARFWQAIDSEEAFDNRNRIAEEVGRLTAADMEQGINGKGRLVVRSFGEGVQQKKLKPGQAYPGQTAEGG